MHHIITCTYLLYHGLGGSWYTGGVLGGETIGGGSRAGDKAFGLSAAFGLIIFVALGLCKQANFI